MPHVEISYDLSSEVEPERILKIVIKVVYRRENSSVQEKVSRDQLTKIQSRPAGLSSLSGSRSVSGGSI